MTPAIKPEILLISGAMFNYIEPDPDVITHEVIAAALSKQCRFAGHVKRFYSVAEHCVRGSYIVPPEHALSFLLHDASEAFVVDVPTPLKRLLGTAYSEIEDKVHRIIETKFGVSIIDNPVVKHADLVMLATEKQWLKAPSPYPWAILDGIEPIMTQNLAADTGNSGRWERRYKERFIQLTHIQEEGVIA